MKAALQAGYPLQAVVIAESILADRWLSLINAHGAGLDPDRSTLGPVAQKAAKICHELTHYRQGEELARRAQSWAAERNQVLHAIAKSAQGAAPSIAAEDFVARAHEVAVRGVELVQYVKRWHRQQLSKANR